MNRKLVLFVLAVGGFAVFAATGRLERTMRVPRCQALDAKGNQCTAQVDPGTPYCWRHRGFVKTMSETLDDAGKGADKTWRSTKNWSTNAWEKTKAGAQSAWDATRDAADGARVGLVELLGGKDASPSRAAEKSSRGRSN